MKSLALICGFCMVSVLYSQAQDQGTENTFTPDQVQFEKAIAYFEAGDLSSAAGEFRKFMVEYPRSPLIARAHYNVAYISFILKDYGTAKMIFKEILTKPYNEQDSNDIMEPYTLYKHHTCRHLAEIALEEKDYEAAEKYIQLFDKQYPYQHFCGNEWSAYDMYVAVMRARVYEGANQVKKALEVLLPYIFTQALASNADVLDELIVVLEKNFTKLDLREEFRRSLSTLTVKKTKKEVNATVTLYGVKVEVEDYMYEEDKGKTLSLQEHYQNVVKENKLFKKFL